MVISMSKYNFDWVNSKQPYSVGTDAFLSLFDDKIGSLYFSSKLLFILEEPDWVKIGIDRKNMTLAVKVAEKEEENSIFLNQGAIKYNAAKIHSKDFSRGMRELLDAPEGTLRFPVTEYRESEKMVIFDLTKYQRREGK